MFKWIIWLWNEFQVLLGSFTFEIKLVFDLVKLLSKILNFHLGPSNLAPTLKIEVNKLFQIFQELKCFILVHVMNFESFQKIWPEFFFQLRKRVITFAQKAYKLFKYFRLFYCFDNGLCVIFFSRLEIFWWLKQIIRSHYVVNILWWCWNLTFNAAHAF